MPQDVWLERLKEYLRNDGKYIFIFIHNKFKQQL